MPQTPSVFWTSNHLTQGSCKKVMEFCTSELKNIRNVSTEPSSAPPEAISRWILQSLPNPQTLSTRCQNDFQASEAKKKNGQRNLTKTDCLQKLLDMSSFVFCLLTRLLMPPASPQIPMPSPHCYLSKCHSSGPPVSHNLILTDSTRQVSQPLPTRCMEALAA